ncbi:MAG: hypothetical protein ACC628_10270, partial [Pirellulaceae bacterium]
NAKAPIFANAPSVVHFHQATLSLSPKTGPYVRVSWVTHAERRARVTLERQVGNIYNDKSATSIMGAVWAESSRVRLPAESDDVSSNA